ncbi:B12-binding domain-containing radical SAM protein [Rubricoccus marinus]|uniref:Uncharacterized protein n=1 Tax=Rubricoccus marinus TaxID=716817 RepID=A0A259U0D1_9BACT|nr:radical SAM protein [Rubricoccus marinus]OZC03298.1 hypothetical protein BSZ36_10090 [Rubricoccus marinus]
MRILLVRPPVPKHTVGLKHIMICEPLELEYVAAGISPEHEIEIIDLILEKGWDRKGLERRLKRFKPDVVGTSCYINGVNEVKKICRAAKRWSLDCKTIVGGVHAARAPEDFADPSVDVIVTGDGTTVIQQVLDVWGEEEGGKERVASGQWQAAGEAVAPEASGDGAASGGTPEGHASGVSLREGPAASGARGEAGKTVQDALRHPTAPAATSLREISGLAIPVGPRQVEKTATTKHYMPPPDTLPFPRRDLVAHLRDRYYYLFHRPVTTMKTTWGCWFRCNFCFTWTITDGTPFSRSPESIVDELETIETEDVYIVDDIFLINRKRLDKIAALLRARGIRKKYLIYARADFISENEDIIEEWSELGLSAIIVGLEAATDDELVSMNKECSVDYNRTAIAILQKHGVDCYGSLIPHPDYTDADWDRLQDFINETGLYYLNISPLTPLPGTGQWEDHEDDIVIPRDAHGLWDLSHAVLPTRMSLKRFYRRLLGVYVRSTLDMRRAQALSLRTRPPIWSPAYLRLWKGALSIWFQFRNLHTHHSPRAIRQAQDKGKLPAGLSWPAASGDGQAGAPPVGFESVSGEALKGDSLAQRTTRTPTLPPSSV